MTYAAATLPWALVILLVWALLEGQPSGTADMVSRSTALATENASLRATVYALPKPTPVLCQYGTARVVCQP